MIHAEATDTDLLTVWVPITEATEENGCLVVVPRSHKRGLGLHCVGAASKTKGIPHEHLGAGRASVPMQPGDVLFMNKLTMHSSLPNVSEDIRWSLDFRYNPIGQPTGHPWFPGFVARSRANPETELREPEGWDQIWQETRSRLAKSEEFNLLGHWDPQHPGCA